MQSDQHRSKSLDNQARTYAVCVWRYRCCFTFFVSDVGVVVAVDDAAQVIFVFVIGVVLFS